MALLSSKTCLAKFGEPGGSNQSSYMTLWIVPGDILSAFAHVKFSAVGTIGFPKKIFCHKLMQPKLEAGLRCMMAKNITHTLTSWDGCLQIRTKRLNSSYSLHSWGLGFDCNAAENLQGKEGNISTDLVDCFKATGLDWGGDFTGKSIDKMHFQIAATDVK